MRVVSLTLMEKCTTIPASPRQVRSRLLRRIIWLVATVMFVYTGLSIFGAVAAMEIPRLPVSESPVAVGVLYEDVSFLSRGDPITLRGWLIPGGGDRALIIVHGGYQNRVDEVVNTLCLARDLSNKGWDVLLFDLRGRGESDGKGYSLLNIESDIGGAVDYLKSKGYPAGRIGIVGFCAGAASACIFASEEPVGILVLNGCFSSVESIVDTQAAQRHIPRFLVNYFKSGVRLATQVMYGYHEVNPIDVVGKVDCPILFVHEEYDDIIPREDNLLLLQSTRNPADVLWEVDGAKHSEAYRTHPAEYIQKVADFLDKEMVPVPAGRMNLSGE